MKQGSLRRCTQCRKRFVPAPSALTTQTVCGAAECQRTRRNGLARRRRQRDVLEYRDDERQRQQKCRALRCGEPRSSVAEQPASATEGVAVTPPTGRDVTACHVPASAQTTRQFTLKMLSEWDRAAAASRATLEREMTAILGQINAFGGR